MKRSIQEHYLDFPVDIWKKNKSCLGNQDCQSQAS